MDIIIRFIGLILLYQSPGPHRAIVPQWVAAENDHADVNFCSFPIDEHRPYIRVSKLAVVDDSKWRKTADCDPGLDCVVYRIEDGTTLSIDFGGEVQARAKQPVPCFVPDLVRDHLVDRAVLRDDVLSTRSATDYVLPNGPLAAKQFANDQIYVMLTVPVAVAKPPKPVRIIAKNRKDGSVAGELQVKAGATIDILDVSPHHAVMDYNTIRHDGQVTELELKGHAYFMRKLIDNPDPNVCGLIPDVAPETCGSLVRNHLADLGTTQDLGCGTLTASGTMLKK